MFPKGVVQLISYKGGRDCQDDGWLSLRGHCHRDSQGYRKRWVCPGGSYNLISIRVLDEEECRIQMQQGIITVSQEDRVILEGEKCRGLYKLKERTQLEVEFQG